MRPSSSYARAGRGGGRAHRRHYEETLRALDVSFSKATHIYNEMSPFEHRGPNTVGALLANNRVRTDMIANGRHVHEGALFLTYWEKAWWTRPRYRRYWRRPGWLKASTGAGFAWRTAPSACPTARWLVALSNHGSGRAQRHKISRHLSGGRRADGF